MVVTTMCLLLQSKSGRNRRRRRNSSGSGSVTSEDGDSPRSPLPDVLDEINHDEQAECTCTAEEVEERQNKLSNEDVLIEEKPDEAHEIATEPGEKQIEAASEVGKETSESVNSNENEELNSDDDENPGQENSEENQQNSKKVNNGSFNWSADIPSDSYVEKTKCAFDFSNSVIFDLDE